MRAIQRAIVGVGLALVAVVAMALLIGDRWSAETDPSSQASTQATSPKGPLVDVPEGPPEPVDAAEDTSVGTLPPPADASLDTQQISRDLLAPPTSPNAPDTRAPQAPRDGKTMNARKSPGQRQAETSGPALPQQDVTSNQDGWAWDGWHEWDDVDGSYGDERDDDEDCRSDDRDDRYDRRHDCDDRDRDRDRRD
ncbi:hypothetical protein [Nocardioides turkmenicus]|uniref:hypothetical protein n=1 Tax=Nocardioides turkmenicus TaxID=2711220 RepID=UPI0019D11D66|nr:hypothetical protein [Nocardioides sp. KC13]